MAASSPGQAQDSMRSPRICVYCRTKLHWQQRSDALYCSGTCRTRAYRQRREVLPSTPIRREVIEEEYWPDGWPGRFEDYPGWSLEEVTFATDARCTRCRRAMRQGLLVTLLLPSRVTITAGLYCRDDCLLDTFV